MSWIPLDYVIEKVKSRRFNWIANPALKYIEIRIDMRDDHCIVRNRYEEPVTVATTKFELDELFDKLNKLADETPIYKR